MKITTACNSTKCFRAFSLGLSLTFVYLDHSKKIVFPTVVKHAQLSDNLYLTSKENDNEKMIRFEHLLAVHFHCVLPVEVNLFLALYFHAIPGPLSWFKVKFCFIIIKKRKYIALRISIHSSVHSIAADSFMKSYFFSIECC